MHMGAPSTRHTCTSVGAQAVPTAADFGRGAELALEDCVIHDCEDGVSHTYGEGLTLRRCRLHACDCDGIFSVPKIRLLEDVSFVEIGRHEVHCAAGVARTIGTPPPPPAPS